MGGDDYPDICLVSPKGHCYSNQLNLWDVHRCLRERPLLFDLAFDNGSDDHEAAFKALNGNNPATLCTNLVNFRPIILEFSLLKRAILAAIRPQFDDGLYLSPWHYEMDWKSQF